MSRNGYHNLNHDEILDALNWIPCEKQSYGKWIAVGMALKESGLPCSVWDDWSSKDKGETQKGKPRYRVGLCARKWNTFNRHDVTAKTIFYLAISYGWKSKKGFQWDDGSELLDWDSVFEYVPDDDDDQKTTDKDLTPTPEEEGTADVIPMLPLPKPGDVFGDGKFKPTREFLKYIARLFPQNAVVNYAPRSYWDEDDGKWKPSAIFAKSFTMPAIEFGGRLKQSGDDLPKEFTPENDEAGAWIRINPIKPDTATRKKPNEAVGDSDITEYRYTLVECDDLPPEEQYSRIKWLDLPVAIMVHSGGRSIHAIVKIDAKDKVEYGDRVNFLYEYCSKNGLPIDNANKNPSRFSRVPGVMRGGKPQYIVSLACGKASWLEWRKAVDPDADEVKAAEKAEEEDLPLDDIGEVLKAPPEEESPDLIKGILKKGGKAIVQSESKAGKSFLMIELSMAFAAGGTWIGSDCTKSKVLVLNLELSRKEYRKRCIKVASAMGVPPEEVEKRMIVSHLRGQETKIEKIKNRIISTIKKNGIEVLIIDPLYKISDKDENSAKEMGELFSNIDEIVETTGCTCFIVHHHPKSSNGYSAQNKGSGSGVIARDADAIIDLSEITKGVPEAKKLILRQRKLDYTARKLNTCLGDEWMDTINAQGTDSAELLIEKAKDHLTGDQLNEIYQKLLEIDVAVESMTAWLVSYSLREFRTPRPIPVWFDHPIHTIDETGMLNSGNYSTTETDQGKTQMTPVQKRHYLFGEALAQAEKDGDLSRDHVVALYNKLAERKGVTTLEENTKNPSTIAKYAVANGWTYRTKTKDFAKADYTPTEEDTPFSDQLI